MILYKRCVISNELSRIFCSIIIYIRQYLVLKIDKNEIPTYYLNLRFILVDV